MQQFFSDTHPCSWPWPVSVDDVDSDVMTRTEIANQTDKLPLPMVCFTHNYVSLSAIVSYNWQIHKK